MGEVEKLQEFEQVRGNLRLPADMKPCIVDLLKDPPHWKDDKLKPFIVGCELYRIGQTEEQIESVLTEIGIRSSHVRSVVGSVVRGRYQFGCVRLESEGICLYNHRKECHWWQAIPKRSRKSYNERDFWRYCWLEKLSPAEAIVYLSLREIEKRRNYPAGTRMYISRKQLSGVTGISGKWVMRSCEKLEKVGLIEFKKGTQHKHYGKASEVKRILPIPKPQ